MLLFVNKRRDFSFFIFFSNVALLSDILTVWRLRSSFSHLFSREVVAMTIFVTFICCCSFSRSRQNPACARLHSIYLFSFSYEFGRQLFGSTHFRLDSRFQVLVFFAELHQLPQFFVDMTINLCSTVLVCTTYVGSDVWLHRLTCCKLCTHRHIVPGGPRLKTRLCFSRILYFTTLNCSL